MARVEVGGREGFPPNYTPRRQLPSPPPPSLPERRKVVRVDVWDFSPTTHDDHHHHRHQSGGQSRVGGGGHMGFPSNHIPPPPPSPPELGAVKGARVWTCGISIQPHMTKDHHRHYHHHYPASVVEGSVVKRERRWTHVILPPDHTRPTPTPPSKRSQVSKKAHTETTIKRAYPTFTSRSVPEQTHPFWGVKAVDIPRKRRPSALSGFARDPRQTTPRHMTQPARQRRTTRGLFAEMGWLIWKWFPFELVRTSE